ncbi:MAG TPA: 50S ribosomal protein L11 methyltransferase [Bacteroidia bacterium]|jgi:ribosomal protein L11 methyltransferase|nr:50S ribosomal protein L11 methyltransferase [Bacteroidia bacterium]
MNYIELSVQVEPKEQGSDVLIAQLAELGFESFVETEMGFNAYIQEIDYNQQQLAIALSYYTDFFKFNYSSTTIQQQNWNKEWENNFQPIQVKDKCYIRAPFHESQPGFLYDVIIEPKMSFGTGHHSTTQLMIEKLLTLDINKKSVLDMGCGTGVLAIVASKMGANPITAIDIDEWSYENTIENCSRNNINNVDVHKGNAQILAGRVFHSILANINKNVLLKDLESYSAALENSGNLIISGFFETDIDELLAKSAEFDFKLKDTMVKEKWAMLHFIK